MEFGLGADAAVDAGDLQCPRQTQLLKALDGDLAALTAIRLWINRDPRDVLAAQRVVRPITGLAPGGSVEHFQLIRHCF